MLDFRTSKFVLRISRDSYQLLKRHLQERQNNQIWSIVQEHLYIDIFDGMPRSKQQIDAMVGSLSGEARREANKVKVCANINRDLSMIIALSLGKSCIAVIFIYLSQSQNSTYLVPAHLEWFSLQIPSLCLEQWTNLSLLKMLDPPCIVALGSCHCQYNEDPRPSEFSLFVIYRFSMGF